MMEERFHVGVKALILNDMGEILVLKANPEEMRQNQPVHWDLPGGRIKGGDSIESTLRKEIKEELGVDSIEILEHFDTSISNLKIPVDGEIVGLLTVIYKCNLPVDSKLELSSEHLEYKWVSIEEAKELLKVKFANSFIEKLNTLN